MKGKGKVKREGSLYDSTSNDKVEGSPEHAARMSTEQRTRALILPKYL